jgi:hypothetical protein
MMIWLLADHSLKNSLRRVICPPFNEKPCYNRLQEERYAALRCPMRGEGGGMPWWPSIAHISPPSSI